HRPHDLHTLVLKGEIRLPQRRLAVDLEGDVLDTEPAGHRGLGRRRIRDREEVERMRVAGQGHEQAAVLRVLLHDLEAEDRGVELPRALEIAHAEEYVTDSLELDHVWDTAPRTDLSQARPSPYKPLSLQAPHHTLPRGDRVLRYPCGLPLPL